MEENTRALYLMWACSQRLCFMLQIIYQFARDDNDDNMIDGKLCSTNIELILCDDDTESDHDECLSDLVICLASDYQKVVMPKERSLARIDNDKQTAHPKHTSLTT